MRNVTVGRGQRYESCQQLKRPLGALLDGGAPGFWARVMGGWAIAVRAHRRQSRTGADRSYGWLPMAAGTG